MACEICRAKKVKCNLERPSCAYCKDHRFQCAYKPRAKRGSKQNEEFQERFQRLESLIQTLQPQESVLSTSSPSTSHTERMQADAGRPTIAEYDRSMVCVAGAEKPLSFLDELSPPVEDELQTIVIPPQDGTREQSTPTVGFKLDKENSLIEEILWRHNKKQAQQHQREDDENVSGALLGENLQQEFAGPSCALSALSGSGLQRIEQIAKSDKSIHAIRSLVAGITTQVRLDLNALNIEPPSAVKRPLPPRDVSTRYAQDYFDRIQHILPVLRHSAVIEMMDKYYNNPESVDCSSYALLSTVLALGCRARLSSGSPASFRESEEEAWALFSNSTSVEAKMMHQPTTLQSVQALILMTIFSQGLGGPQSEMIYCTAAVRLAHSLGMHKAPLASWKLSRREINDRNCAFWSIYFLDKTLSMRSGRPSIMMDEDIECPFPAGMLERYGPEVVESDQPHFDYFLGLVQYASISSKIYRRFYTSKETRKPVTQMVKNAWALSHELQRWRDGITELPPADKMADTFRLTQGLSGFELSRAAFLRFFYWEGLLSVYKACHSNGLFSERLAQQLTSEEAQRLHEISLKGVEAARSIILLVQQIEVESHTPGWLVIYYPLMALITIFMDVINNPKALSVTENIAAMEMVTGFFARVDFLTAGQLQLTNCREFSAIARAVVENAKDEAAQTRERSSLQGGTSESTVSESTHAGDPTVALRLDTSSPQMNDLDHLVSFVDFVPPNWMEWSLTNGHHEW